MSDNAEFENGEIPDAAVIQFGNYVERLLFLTFVGRNKHREFPIVVKFGKVIMVLEEEWGENPFSVAFLQDPKTIDPLIREFHEYNLLPLPPEPHIRKKIAVAEKFVRYLSRRFPDLFRGSQLVLVEPTIEDYIHDAFTGELLPPLGLQDQSEIHPLDRSYVEKVRAVEKRHPVKKPDIPIKEIRASYPVHRIKCECCSDWIPCPTCARTDLLRGWGLGERTVALCYGCGALFFADTAEIITEIDGDRDFWGAQAIAIIGSFSLKG